MYGHMLEQRGRGAELSSQPAPPNALFPAAVSSSPSERTKIAAATTDAPQDTAVPRAALSAAWVLTQVSSQSL